MGPSFRLLFQSAAGAGASLGDAAERVLPLTLTQLLVETRGSRAMPEVEWERSRGG